MTTVFVSSFNHASLDGVAEIVDLLREEFARAGFDTVSCKTLPPEISDDDVLVLVDEFSEPFVVEALRRLRQARPGVKLVCVLTEFFSAGGYFRPPSLNNFKEPLRSLLFDNLLYVFCHLTKRNKVYPGLTLNAPRLVNYIAASLAMCLLALIKAWKIKTPIKTLASFHERGYLWFRTMGLLATRGIFDHYFVLHQAIASEALAAALKTETQKFQFLIIPPPPVDKAGLVNPDLNFGIDFSGSISPYRKWQLWKLRKLLTRLSPGERFADFMLRGFDDSKMENYLSFNPPQSSKWRYSSPMRIIGALKRGQIPVVPRKFADHPAEDLAIEIPRDPNEALKVITSLIFYEHFYLDTAWENLDRYRGLAESNNHETIMTVFNKKSGVMDAAD